MAVILADSPASLIGAAALIITAIGGLVTGIIAARRQPQQVPNAVEVWVETLHQLDLVHEERDRATAERDEARRDLRRWKATAQECEKERLELLRRLAAE